MSKKFSKKELDIIINSMSKIELRRAVKQQKQIFHYLKAALSKRTGIKR